MHPDKSAVISMEQTLSTVKEGVFMNIVKDVFAMKGRLNRQTHFKYQMIWIMLVAVSTIISSLTIEFLTGVPDSDWSQMVKMFLFYVGLFGFFIITVRRLHDLNLSGAFAAAIFVPLIGVFFLFYLFAAAGTAGANKYGEEPLTD